ncbi:RNA polymerase sigma factor [Nocardia amikacinitolerans]|uniref:RNA polymerase sigma factor n=1 Tax=Nocardia amikacinitolerans TaxID=756689 RepID=UPI0036C80A2C
MTDRKPSSEEEKYYRIVEHYAPAVFRYALKSFRGDTDRAHDIVQQVFFAVWQQYDRDFLGRPESRIEKLIMRMASCRVKDAWRCETRGAVSVSEHLDAAIPMFARRIDMRTPEERVLSNDELEHFREALMHNLTETEYRVALLAWDEGRSDSEIAQILARTVSTVHSHKSRARKKIQAMVHRGEHRIAFDPADTGHPKTLPGPTNGGEASA